MRSAAGHLFPQYQQSKITIQKIIENFYRQSHISKEDYQSLICKDNTGKRYSAEYQYIYQVRNTRLDHLHSLCLELTLKYVREAPELRGFPALSEKIAAIIHEAGQANITNIDLAAKAAGMTNKR